MSSQKNLNGLKNTLFLLDSTNHYLRFLVHSLIFIITGLSRSILLDIKYPIFLFIVLHLLHNLIFIIKGLICEINVLSSFEIIKYYLIVHPVATVMSCMTCTYILFPDHLTGTSTLVLMRSTLPAGKLTQLSPAASSLLAGPITSY